MLSQNNFSSVISSVGEELALKELIIAAKKGDNDAFGTLYTKLFTPLYRYVHSRIYDEEVTKDICQQTFLKFYEALATYEPKKSPLAYLFTTAKHLLINHRVKKSSISFDETFSEIYADESIKIIDEADTKMLISSINDLLPSLSEDEQDIIRLYFYAELSYKEIAEILDKEETHLRKLKERALKKLRALTLHLDGKI